MKIVYKNKNKKRYNIPIWIAYKLYVNIYFIFFYYIFKKIDFFCLLL